MPFRFGARFVWVLAGILVGFQLSSAAAAQLRVGKLTDAGSHVADGRERSSGRQLVHEQAKDGPKQEARQNSLRNARKSTWLWTTGLYIIATCCLLWSVWFCTGLVRNLWSQSDAARQARGQQVRAGSGGSPPSTPRSEAWAPSEGEEVGRRTTLTEALLGRSAEEDPSRLNRERFEETRRNVALQMFINAYGICVCFACLGVVLAFCALIFYLYGWGVWYYHKDKSCDQPLEWWLLVMLCLPGIICCVRSRFFMHFSTHSMIIAGAWMYFSCKTCKDTNPALYNYVRWYIIFLIGFWVAQLLFFFGLVGFAFWMSSYGLLDSGPGPRMAGRAGLIDDIETVEFSPDLFVDEAAPECCVCQEEFSREKPIKRTPCGHIFHEECLGDWLGRYSKTCPVCRTDLEERSTAEKGPASRTSASAGAAPATEERPTAHAGSSASAAVVQTEAIYDRTDADPFLLEGAQQRRSSS
eukprot:TRINITY_DN124585_c0_g1_i1.p1 TRINITY_DN124585_c0_g1~~TRINITY_DN124585_c0_g1_i1.p1  ORF type:complete len:469 (+),score=59.80 TRINITY_DN124585_c0_g1_i1:121-1527(+)